MDNTVCGGRRLLSTEDAKEWAEETVSRLSFAAWSRRGVEVFQRMVENRGRTFANYCENGHFFEEKGSNPLVEFGVLELVGREHLNALREVMARAHVYGVHTYALALLKERVREQLRHMPRGVL